MAVRYVSTVFAVEGEDAYRKAVQGINRDLKELDSEMRLLEETYRGNENSMEAIAAKTDLLNRRYEEQENKVKEIEKALENCTKSADEYRAAADKLAGELDDVVNAMRELEDAGEKGSDAYEELSKKQKELASDLEYTNSKMAAAERGVSDWTIKLNNAKTDLEKTGNAMKELGNGAEDMGNRASDAMEVLASAEIFDRTREGLEAVIGLLKDCADSYIEFESAMAGVEKTVDGTAEEYAELASGIKELATEIPATTTEIAAVAEAAGQLGIEKDNILNFTEVMVKMGTSTNMSATEAAEALAKFANVVKMDAADYERLGSTIVALGNNFATTETDIVNMTTRLAATGELVDLTEPQMLALATACSSLGIEAEAGGTAVAKLLKAMETAVETFRPAMEVIQQTGYSLRDLELMSANSSGDFKAVADSIGVTSTELERYIGSVKKLNQFAEISGVSADEFIKAWGTDAVGALQMFIDGLGDMEESGESAVAALSEIAGMSEVRLSNAVLALASSEGILTDALDTANTAWEENTALAEEAAKRYETTESKIVLMQNSFENLKIAIGEDFADAFEPIIEGLTSFADAATEAAEESPALSAGLAGVAGALAGITAVSGAAAVIQLIVKSLSLFGAAAGPIGVAAAAVGALGGALLVYSANLKELPADIQAAVDASERLTDGTDAIISGFQETNDAIEINRDKVSLLTERLEELTAAWDGTPASAAVIEGVIAQLNELLPGLGLTFDSLTGKVNKSTEEIMSFAGELERITKLDATQQYINDLMGQQAAIEIQIAVNDEELRDAEIALEAARSKYDSASATPSDTWGGYHKSNNNLNELRDELTRAQNAVDALRESQTDLQDSWNDIDKELSTATGLYDEYAASLSSVASETEALNEAQASQVEGLREAGELSEEHFANQLAAAENYYETSRDLIDDYYDDLIKAEEDKTDDLLKARKRSDEDALKAYKKSLDSQLDALKKAHKEELRELEDFWDEKLDLIRENSEKERELAKGTASDAVQALQDQIDAIDKLTEQEEKEEEQRRKEKKLQDAQDAIDQAKTNEERLAAQQEYKELVLEYEREAVLEQRELEKEKLQAEIDRIEEELEKELEKIDAAEKAFLEAEEAKKEAAIEALQAEHEAELQAVQDRIDANYAAKQRELEDLTALYKTELDKQLADYRANMEAKRAEDTADLESTISATKASIEAAYSEWKAMGFTAGSAFGEGYNEGLQSTAESIKTTASKIASIPGDVTARVTETASPSKQAKRYGKWWDEGLALGLLENADMIRSAMAAVAKATDLMEYKNNAEDVTLRFDRATTEAAEKLAATVVPKGWNNPAERSEINTYNIVVSAKDVKEFNDIVRIAESKRVEMRMGYVGK